MRIYEKPESIPLLVDVLEALKGKDFFIDVELKAYKPSWKRRKIGREVAKIISRMNMKQQLMCTSFNFFMLRDLEKEDRSVLSGFAYDDNMPISMNRLNWFMESNLIGKWVHSNSVCSEYTIIDEDTVKKYHARGMKVGSFTLYPFMSGEMPANKKAHYSKEVKRLAKLGVDLIETDQPELVFEDLNS